MRLHWSIKRNYSRVSRRISGRGMALSNRSWRLTGGPTAPTLQMHKREPVPVDETWLASKRRRRG